MALAEQQLAQVGVEIEPRGMWPTGMDRLGIAAKGKIGPDVVSHHRAGGGAAHRPRLGIGVA